MPLRTTIPCGKQTGWRPCRATAHFHRLFCSGLDGSGGGGGGRAPKSCADRGKPERAERAQSDNSNLDDRECPSAGSRATPSDPVVMASGEKVKQETDVLCLGQYGLSHQRICRRSAAARSRGPGCRIRGRRRYPPKRLPATESWADIGIRARQRSYRRLADSAGLHARAFDWCPAQSWSGCGIASNSCSEVSRAALRTILPSSGLARRADGRPMRQAGSMFTSGRELQKAPASRSFQPPISNDRHSGRTT